MTQEERIEALEREVELLRAQVAGLLARPHYIPPHYIPVPTPAPYRPYQPWQWGSGTSSVPPAGGRTINAGGWDI